MDTTTLEGPVTKGRTAPPLWLVGPARSGTSLLYKLLCLHPDAAYVSNYVARRPSAPWLSALERLPRGAARTQRRVWFGGEGSNAYVYGKRRALMDRLVPMPVEGEPLFRAAGLSPDGVAPGADKAQVAERLRDAVASICRSSRAPVFVNKRIANNYRIPILAHAFPDARFVALVRDGRAVALSLSKVDWWLDSRVPWYGGTPRGWAAEGRDPWELCARNWMEELRVMEEGLAAVPGSQVLRLGYEDLIADPVARLDDVAAFAGLGPSADWHRRLDAIRFPNRNEAWREELDPAALETITRVQAATLEAYGYAR